MRSFAGRISAWQRAHGRHGLPWQGADAYRVWLSEIMLQQTQVATVVPYYLRFLARFPDVRTLAAASEDEVLRLWSGLGYYARARNLHGCARKIVAAGSEFPRDAQSLAQLPGIGRSTAAAIAAFCFGARAAILDGNVKRVLTRHFGIEGFPSAVAVERKLWSLAESLLPTAPRVATYTQGLMDLGATICLRLRPQCGRCPLQRSCVAFREGRTAELPTPRPRRSKRVRSVRMLVLLRGGQVLVERRPGAGLWGGLLSLPQFDSEEQLHQALCALAPHASARPLAVRRHAFTHFTLEFTPHLATVKSAAAMMLEPRMFWLKLNEVEDAALPTPIRALLRDVGRESATRSRARSVATAPPARTRG